MESSASSRSSAWEILDRRTNEREMLVQSLAQINSAFPQLSTVKSCAAVGCGYGHIDLEFISRCLPNVERLAAVEPDGDQMASFKTRVAQLLPNVITDFCQETAQSWKGSDQPFDVVLLFHCLYFVPPVERPSLFKKLFDNVATSGSLVFILTSPCNLQNPTSIRRLLDLLSLPSYNFSHCADGVQLSNMMTSVGFRLCYQLPIEIQFDVAEQKDDLMSTFAFFSRGELSLERVREAANELLGSGKLVQDEMWLGVFQKP